MKDEQPAPTPRETADHAELLDRAEKWVAEMGEFDDLNPSRAEAYIHGSLLLSEIAALRGEVERVEANHDIWVEIAEERLARTTQAERQRDELRKALEFYADRDKWSDYWTDALAAAFDRNGGSELGDDEGDIARQALANQGADQ